MASLAVPHRTRFAYAALQHHATGVFFAAIRAPREVWAWVQDTHDVGKCVRVLVPRRHTVQLQHCVRLPWRLAHAQARICSSPALPALRFEHPRLCRARALVYR